MDSTASRPDVAKRDAKTRATGEWAGDDDCYMTRLVEASHAERPAALVVSSASTAQSSRHPGGNSAKTSWKRHEEEEEEDCVILGEARSMRKVSDEAMTAGDASLARALASEETKRWKFHLLSSTGPENTPSSSDEARARVAADARLAAALAAEEEEALLKGVPSSSSGGPRNTLSVSDDARLAEQDARLAAALAAEEEAEARRGGFLPSPLTGLRNVPSEADDASLAAALAAEEEEEQERERQLREAAAHEAAAHASEEFPDLVSLFLYYNDLYFDGTLVHCIVQWSSPRMTLCAGICAFDGVLCTIRLSEPLLKYRPVKDMKETLLHEMIHAFIFLKMPGHTHEDHGPMFCGIMEKINQSTVVDRMRPEGGYKITVYHSFHDEVDHYRKHHWTCDRCGRVVRRAMNRPPSLADCFSRRMRRAANGMEGPCTHPSCLWHRHIQTCGGAFVKTAEPEKAARGKGDKGLGSPSKAKVSIADMLRRRAEELGQKREEGSSQEKRVGLGGWAGTQEAAEGAKSRNRRKGEAQGKRGGTRKDGPVRVKIEGEERGKRQRKKGGEGKNETGAQRQSGAGEGPGTQGQGGAQSGHGSGQGSGESGKVGADPEGPQGSGGRSMSGAMGAVGGLGKAGLFEFGAEWACWDDREFRLMQEQILASCQAGASTMARE